MGFVCENCGRPAERVVRVRPIYEEWSAAVTVELDTSVMTVEQLVNLVRVAGFSCGLGEWRPSAPKSQAGDYGRFEVVAVETITEGE